MCANARRDGSATEASRCTCRRSAHGSDRRYTPEMKTAMVLKAKDVIRRGCLEYDVSATDITSSFMAIRKTMTSSGRSATYEASRSEEASHADLAWATMHALLNEPLTAGISTPLTSTILEFY